MDTTRFLLVIMALAIVTTQVEADDGEKTKADNFIEGDGVNTNIHETGATKLLDDVSRTRDAISAQQVSSDHEPDEGGNKVASTEKMAQQSVNGLLRLKLHRRQASKFLQGGRRMGWGAAEEEEEDEEKICHHQEKNQREKYENFYENHAGYKEGKKEGKMGIVKTSNKADCGERSCEGTWWECTKKERSREWEFGL